MIVYGIERNVFELQNETITLDIRGISKVP